MTIIRPQGARVAGALAATAAAGTLTFFVGMAAAQADDSTSAAPSSSDVVSAQPQVTTVSTATDSATSSAAADNCPATVVIVPLESTLRMRLPTGSDMYKLPTLSIPTPFA